MDVRIEEVLADIFSPLLQIDRGEVEEIIRIASACLRVQLKEFQKVKTRQEFLELVYNNLSLPLMMHIFKRKEVSGGLQRFQKDLKSLLGTSGKKEEEEKSESGPEAQGSSSSELPQAEKTD